MALTVAEKAILGSIYSISIILALVGNTILLVAILKSKKLRSNVSSHLLVSVLLARDLIALCVIPVELLALLKLEKSLGWFWCKACFYSAGTSTTATAYSLALLGFERMKTLKNKQKFFASKKQFAFAIGTIWGSSCIYNISMWVIKGLFSTQDAQTGEVDWFCGTDPAYMHVDKILAIVDALIACLIPLTIVLYSFMKVGRFLLREVANESSIEHSGQEPSNKDEDAQVLSVPKKAAARTLEMSLVMVVIFVICTSAPYAARILALWFGIYNEMAIKIVLAIMFTNPWITWIIFLIYREDLREAVHSMLRRKGNA